MLFVVVVRIQMTLPHPCNDDEQDTEHHFDNLIKQFMKQT